MSTKVDKAVKSKNSTAGSIDQIATLVKSALLKLRNLDGSGGTLHERSAIDEHLNQAIVILTEEGILDEKEGKVQLQEGEKLGIEEHTSSLDPLINKQADIAAQINANLPPEVTANENTKIVAKPDTINLRYLLSDTYLKDFSKAVVASSDPTLPNAAKEKTIKVKR